MDLKQFIEKNIKENTLLALPMLQKMMDLDAIEHWLNVMYGIELEITVKPAEPRGGRYFDKNLIESLKKDK